MDIHPLCRRWFAVIALIVINVISGAQQPDAKQFSALQWRLIGPFRAGRVTSVAGVPGDPTTFYFGTPGGGVWKTTDGGRVWHPIFDKERVASIGAVALAPSDPRIVFAGTGEQTRGHGVYRSADSGATWETIGLTDVPFIQSIIVDPRNPNILIVGANSVGVGIYWHPYPPSVFTDNRGIFKTTDGGKNWKKVFSVDKELGVVDMCSDPADPRTLYAAIYHPAVPEPKTEATSEIYRSSDEGSTWAPLQSKGLPEKERGRLGIAVAPHTSGRRLYAVLEQGVFRSDDRGATWQRSTTDPRVIGSDYFSRVFADPNHPDTVFVAETSMYRSTDGGKTFDAFAGAPGGDDFHVMWIDPRDSSRMILGVDQGAIISVDGGKTWSSWYNQPTGQFYHAAADNYFPYRVYGAQQDSGTAAVLSRSDYGEILAEDWFSVGGFEYAYIAPDPANSNFVYSGGWYGSVVRLDRTTGQVATVFERGKKYRAAQMPPLVFSPQDPSVLYLGMQFVLRTTDGGVHWQEISPDLTGFVEKDNAERKPGEPPLPAISAIAPSPVQFGEIWAGTSNRCVYLTRDSGASWQNVSPPGLRVEGDVHSRRALLLRVLSEVLYLEPSHHDAATAYLTVGSPRHLTPPSVLRTHDYGKTWQGIINGFPNNEKVRVVREDPRAKGLLYAGTDSGVFISWDDGDHWQPFSLNLPASPVTDLQVHGDDLIISTYGRGLWILDNVSPLREVNRDANLKAADAYLFRPADTTRIRWDNFQDTPYPPETPAGQNPPDGAMIDYFLNAPATGDLTLTIYDQKGQEVIHFSKEAKTPELPPPNIPAFWLAPPPALTGNAGLNRFVWDLRYPAPAVLPYSYEGELIAYTEYTLIDHAVPGQTPRFQPQGPLVAPGAYTAELRYQGKTLRQTFSVYADGRARVADGALAEQRDLALELTRGLKSSYDSFMQLTALHKAFNERKKAFTAADAATKNDETMKKALEKADQFAEKISALEKGTKATPGFGPVNRDLARLLSSVEGGDIRPGEAIRAAVQESCEALEQDIARVHEFNEKDLAAFNQMLTTAKAAPLPAIEGNSSGCK